MLSRIPQHKNDSIPASINSTSISPPCENIEPESLVPNYTSTTAESGRTDPSSGHTRTGGDAPVCIPKTRRRKRIERPKTIDLGSMSDREQLLLSLQQRKVFSFDPIMTSFDLDLAQSCLYTLSKSFFGYLNLNSVPSIYKAAFQYHHKVHLLQVKYIF